MYRLGKKSREEAAKQIPARGGCPFCVLEEQPRQSGVPCFVLLIVVIGVLAVVVVVVVVVVVIVVIVVMGRLLRKSLKFVLEDGCGWR